MSYTATRGSRKVGAVLALVLVLSIAFGALPAFASAASTAFVNVHNVLASQAGKVFTIRVNNTESAGVAGQLAGKTIKEVRIMPPPDLIDAVLPGSAGPGAFTDVRVVGEPPAEIRFRATSGGLAPGANGTFTIAADVRNTLLQDGWENWRIRVTSDLTNYTASTSTGEGLRTDIRVLQVQTVAILAPTGAADDRDGDGKPEVTGTQNNICVRTRVSNAAAGALNVTPGLSGGNITVGNPRNAANPPCSGAELGGGSGSVASHGTRDFDFLVSADNVGSLSASELVGTATAPNATTPATSDPDDDIFTAKQALNIEPKADLTYVTNTLAPRAVVPGATGQAFSLQFNKGPAGSPPVPALSGNFQSPFCNSALSSPTSLAGGSANNLTATFANCNIALIADGRYQPVVNYSYTDGNGLLQPLVDISAGTKPDLEQIRLDRLIPDIHDLAITPPAVQVMADPPAQPAVTNGTAFSASATVTDTSPETSGDVACGPNPQGSTAPLPCTLESAKLIQYPLTAQQGGGAPVGPTIDVKPNCSLSSTGSFSCNINTGGFVTGTKATALELTVKDETGNIVREVSSLVDVDIVAPSILAATTARGGTVMVGNQQVPGQRRTIVVSFDEPVQSDMTSPNDWTIQDGSTKTVCNVSQNAAKTQVTLTTCQELGADSTGTIDYNPRAPLSAPYHDRVGKTVAVPKQTALTDGIEPLAPLFDTVEGKPTQDDAPSTPKYFFNTEAPSVRLVQGTPASEEDPSIADGYTIEVYEESDGTDGLNRLTDRQICGDVSDGSFTQAGPTDPKVFFIAIGCNFSGIDRTRKVYGLSIDSNDNIGQAVNTDFVLDRVRPVFNGMAALAGSDVTVTLNEPLCQLAGHGTETAGNWKFATRRISDNQRVFLPVTTDGDGANASQRKLTFNYGEHSAASVRAEAVQYRFDIGDRYQDRAGNELLDGDQLF